MVAAVRTPLHHGGSLALGRKRYRKEILTKGPLHVDGKVFDVTDDYLDGVLSAFQAGAVASPPIKVADASNTHTKDPFRRHGTVVGLHRTARGLDADLEPDDQLEELITKYPDTGVSVLIEHDRTTGPGQHYDAALAHLLITEDPVINNLGGWALAASHEHDDGDVLDLLALSLASHQDPQPPDNPGTTGSPSSEEGARPDPSEGNDTMPTLADLLTEASDDDLKALRAKLDELAPTDDGDTEKPAEPTDPGAATGSADTGDTPADGAPVVDDDSEPTADDIEAMLATLTDDDQQPEAIAASHSDSGHADQLAAANARLDQQNLALSQMRGELDERNWERERDSLIGSNLTPAIVELAKPFLHGSSTTLALSQDSQAKAAGQVRKLLVEVAKSFKTLGLSQGPLGTAEETPQDVEQRQAAEQRDTTVADHLVNAGLKRTSRRPA